MKSLLQRTALALLLVGAIPATYAEARGTYRVVDTAYNDVLNVRTGPSTRYPIIGMLAPYARGIVVSHCEYRWCYIYHGNTEGWVSRRYIRPE